jgi:carboxymethylenebutenolidase
MILTALLGQFACDESSRTPASASPVDAPQDKTAPAEDAPATEMPVTGLVDEETFKQMHVLRGDAAPTPRGTMVELAGSQAYLSLPTDVKPPIPGIVVIHEWWGLNDHVRHWTDRLAADGYAALAVDLYGGEVATDSEQAMALVKQVDADRANAVLDVAHTFLQTDPRIAAERRGVIGWCFGGGWALQHAIAQPDLDAAVIYYGRPVTDPQALGKIEASLLGVFANQDESIPPAAVDAFLTALERAGKSIEVYRYDAEHAFANPSNAQYDMTAASDAWAHVRKFFERTLRR